MKISELKERKIELGYTNKMVADISGVPLSTVQKIFGGSTEAPRYETLKKIEEALSKSVREVYGTSDNFYERGGGYSPQYVNEAAEPAYEAYSRSAFYGYDEGFRLLGKKQGDYTVEDLDALPDNVRMELIDGVLYDMGSPGIYHQSVISEVFFQLKSAIKASKGECKVFMAPLDVRFSLDDIKNRPQPDLMIVCDKRKYINETGRILGAPDMIMEVVSPSSRSRDRVIKLNKYGAEGVREYWIVDPEFREILVYFYKNGFSYKRYSFNDVVPISIYDGKLSVDFGEVLEYLKEELDFDAE